MTTKAQKTPQDAALDAKVHKMFDKISAHIETETRQLSMDMQLLTDMNNATRAKYAEMSATLARPLIEEMEHIRHRYAELEPRLKDIEEMLKQVDKLETIANELDAWSLDLEARVSKATKK